jgi:hypothetical protein
MDKTKIITLESYNKNKQNKKNFYYVAQIKKSLKYYNISKIPKGKKKELETLLITYFENLNSYSIYTKEILTIQNTFRNYNNNKKIKTQGPGIINKHKCQNHEDFYTLDNINEIEDKYFFSYDQHGHIYFFDIRSFHKLINADCKNPYTREDIPKYAIESFKHRQLELKTNNIIIEEIETPQLTKDQLFNAKVISIFQKIDLLNVSASGTDTKWFTDLNILQLKILYKVLEDIWNYRAELSLTKKKEIVPNNDMFPIHVNDIYYITKKRKLQKIILKEMDKLVSSSPNNDDRMTGAYFILTALVEVSPQCMESLPWLIQQS